MGAYTPEKAWSFAEGTTRPSFNSFLSVLNPNPTVTANIKVTFYRGDGTTTVITGTVAPNARTTIDCAAVLGVAESVASDFSAKVECTNGVWIVCERPMYFNYAGWTGGSCVMGFSE
jgi:hypothetical protein